MKLDHSSYVSYTLKHSVKISGIGIHTGKKNALTLKPTATPGIEFILNNQPPLKADISHLDSSNRATLLSNDQTTIITPEHLLAALYMMNITNCIIECTTEEVPIMDGSARPFIDAIESVGIQSVTHKRPLLSVISPLTIIHNDQSITILPADQLTITYILSPPKQWMPPQVAHYTNLSNDLFKSDIAAARTWGAISDIDDLNNRGLAKGGSFENALVIGDEGYLNEPRFDNECARHKVLDIIGDLSLLNRSINGHIIAHKSGHHLNLELAKKLRQFTTNHTS